jgi:two-component system, NtrC family, response regulator GlrR
VTRTTQPLTDQCLYRVEVNGRLTERKWKLTVVSGPGAGKSVTLSGPLAVGSAKEAGLCLDDEAVSRLHVRLTPRSEGVWVKDLGSLNGTLISGARIEQALVEREATLSIGRSLLRIAAADVDLGAPLGPERFGDAVAQSETMRRVFGLLERLAPTDVPVVLLGETGTGKEVLARALHEASDRKTEPMVVVDCGAIAANLIESELFGHVKGAFTGAVSDRKGAFAQADGGTVFLDEIGELPLDLQTRLLRVLEAGTLKRVGDDQSRHVDVRVIAATHRDLAARVNEGTFRQDLYYRLAVAQVRIPPLRERSEDLPLLVHRFLKKMGKQDFELPLELKARMASYAWPGNVRELWNVVSRAVVGDDRPLESHAAPAPASAARGEVALGVPFKEAKEQLVEVFTRQYLEALLAQHGGNISRAAKVAGIARPHLSKLVARYGLKGSDE